VLRLIFVRHAQSEANLINGFSNRGWKHPLTEKGRAQAGILAAHFLAENVARIFSSSLMRAVQTSEILSRVLSVPFDTTDALREYDAGDYEGSDAEEGWVLKQEMEAAWYTRQDYSWRMPGGESFLEIRARFVSFINQLIQTNRSDNTTIVLVGHGGLYTAMLPEVLINVTRPFMLSHPLGNAGYVISKLQPDGCLACVSWQAEAPAINI